MEQGKLNITGAWTKAGIASCVRVQGATKHDDFLFDCGYFSSETTHARVVLVSHGHIDHVGSCIAHARAKGLSGAPATYYVPRDIVDHLNEARSAFEKLDNAPIPMKIIGTGPGDELSIGTNLRVQVFPTIHRVPSQGYAVFASRRGGLLPELHGLTSDEIRELRQMGQEVQAPDTEVLEMVYTGDTTMAGLLENAENAYIFGAHTFIMELTYLDGDRSKAAEWGHIHLDDVICNAHLFEGVQRLVFVHISQKYSISRIIKILRDQLPASLQPKVYVSLHSFGAAEPLSRLSDRQWDAAQGSTAGWGWSNPATAGYTNYGGSRSGGSAAGGNGGGRSSGRGGGRGGSCGYNSSRGGGGSYGGSSSGGGRGGGGYSGGGNCNGSGGYGGAGSSSSGVRQNKIARTESGGKWQQQEAQQSSSAVPRKRGRRLCSGWRTCLN